MRRRILPFVIVGQSILFLAHWLIYETLVGLQVATTSRQILAARVALAALSVTFLPATLLAWRYSNGLVRGFYRVAAVWLGLLNYLFLAACGSWIGYGLAAALGHQSAKRDIALVMFGAGLVAGIYGLLNSMHIRVRHVTVKLPNLPAPWRGRLAAFVSDVHLGHVRGYRFAKRLAALLTGLSPDIVLVGGDMYDGTKADVQRLAEPFREIVTPLGTYFVAGNHEEFSDRRKYLDAVKRSGVHVLNNEKVVVDGLQIVGVHHHESVNTEQYRAILRQANLDPNCASILLTHAPNHLPVAAEEKIDLQLSGHTHAGQFFPYTWITKRIYGPFVYGLKRLGTLLVYTSCGVGTWGPPLRLGTAPEVVLIGFE